MSVHLLDTGKQVINLKAITYIGESYDTMDDGLKYSIGLGHVVIDVLEKEMPRKTLLKKLAEVE